MTTCVMGLLRLVLGVFRGSPTKDSATGRLPLPSLAPLFTLATQCTTGAAQAQTPNPKLRDSYC